MLLRPRQVLPGPDQVPPLHRKLCRVGWIRSGGGRSGIPADKVKGGEIELASIRAYHTVKQHTGWSRILFGGFSHPPNQFIKNREGL